VQDVALPFDVGTPGLEARGQTLRRQAPLNRGAIPDPQKSR